MRHSRIVLAIVHKRTWVVQGIILDMRVMGAVFLVIQVNLKRKLSWRAPFYIPEKNLDHE